MKWAYLKRGIALLYSMVVLIILGIIGFGVINLFILESKSCAQNLKSTQATYLAHSGIARAQAELYFDSQWATAQAYTQDIGDGKYTVNVQPIGSTPSNLWKVSSLGQIGSTKVQLVAWLSRESFAKYAYFSYFEKTPAGMVFYTYYMDKFTGPVHTNAYFSFWGNPQYSDSVTSSNLEDPNYDAAKKLYKQGGKTYSDPAKFYNYASGYDVDYPVPLNNSPNFSFAGGQSVREAAPPTLDCVKNAADYTITGNVSMEFNGDGTVTVKYPDNSTQVLNIQGKAIWVNGDITSIKGTMVGDCTIGSSNNIVITDDIIYGDKTRDKLGLTATNYIYVRSDPYTLRNLEIDAALLALNQSFEVDSYSNGNYRGYLKVFGSITQKYRGPVGKFQPSTGYPMSGYTKDYIYDKRLRTSPPRAYPMSANIIIKSWQDNRTLAH